GWPPPERAPDVQTASREGGDPRTGPRGRSAGVDALCPAADAPVDPPALAILPLPACGGGLDGGVHNAFTSAGNDRGRHSRRFEQNESTIRFSLDLGSGNGRDRDGRWPRRLPRRPDGDCSDDDARG